MADLFLSSEIPHSLYTCNTILSPMNLHATMLQFLTKPFMLGSEDMSSKNKDRLASPELYKVEGSELEAFIPKEPKRLTDLKQSQLTALKILTSFFGFSTLLLCVYTIVLKRGEVARCSTRENPTSDFGMSSNGTLFASCLK